MNPYEALGLDPGEADPQVIRRAYALKLREHRPDEDPEGFRRIRDAYEFLSAWAKYGGTGAVDEDDDEPEDPAEPEPEEPVAEPAPPPAPAGPLVERRARSVPPAVERWQRAAAAPGSRQRDVELGRAARAIADSMRGDRELTHYWSEQLVAVFGERPDALAAIARNDDLLAELESGRSDVTRGVLQHVFGQRDLSRLASIGRRVRDCREPAVEEQAHLLHFPLAGVLAIAKPRLARELVDRGYVNLSPAGRQQLDLDRIDGLLLAGAEIATWPKSQRFDLAKIMLDGGSVELRGPEGRALLWKLQALPADSALRALLGTNLPPAPGPRSPPAKKESPAGILVSVLFAALFIGAKLMGPGVFHERDASPPKWREEYRKLHEPGGIFDPAYRKLDGSWDVERWLRDHRPPGLEDGPEPSNLERLRRDLDRWRGRLDRPGGELDDPDAPDDE